MSSGTLSHNFTLESEINEIDILQCNIALPIIEENEVTKLKLLRRGGFGKVSLATYRGQSVTVKKY